MLCRQKLVNTILCGPTPGLFQPFQSPLQMEGDCSFLHVHLPFSRNAN